MNPKDMTKDQMIRKIMTKVRQMTKPQLKRFLAKLNRMNPKIEGFPFSRKSIKQDPLLPRGTRLSNNNSLNAKINDLNQRYHSLKLQYNEPNHTNYGLRKLDDLFLNIVKQASKLPKSGDISNPTLRHRLQQLIHEFSELLNQQEHNLKNKKQ